MSTVLISLAAMAASLIKGQLVIINGERVTLEATGIHDEFFVVPYVRDDKTIIYMEPRELPVYPRFYLPRLSLPEWADRPEQLEYG